MLSNSSKWRLDGAKTNKLQFKTNITQNKKVLIAYNLTAYSEKQAWKKKSYFSRPQKSKFFEHIFVHILVHFRLKGSCGWKEVMAWRRSATNFFLQNQSCAYKSWKIRIIIFLSTKIDEWLNELIHTFNEIDDEVSIHRNFCNKKM